MVVALIFTITASIVPGPRVYIRIWIKRTFGWDDGLIIFSLVTRRWVSIFLHRLTCVSSLRLSQQPLTYPK